jgi:membrane protease YdiL (CAAX protease family)
VSGEQRIVWWHPSWRVAIAVAVSGATAIAAVVAALRGLTTIAAILTALVVATVLLQTRPWFYAHVRRAPLVFRLLSIVAFVVPDLAIASSRITTPKPVLGVVVGTLAGLALFAVFHARDSVLLLNPAIVAIQPRMSVAGAVGRFLYVLAVVPLEEIFYRRLIIENVAPHFGAVLAIMTSILAFVYGDWCGSWGPTSRQKRLWSEVALATVLAVVYFWTGSLVAVMVAHYLYNGPQLLLPPINLAVHRRNRSGSSPVPAASTSEEQMSQGTPS